MKQGTPPKLNGSNRRIELWIALGLIIGVILMRWPWQISVLNNLDAGNYALAVTDFDVRYHQTQPPGYYLYIMGVRAVHLFAQDTVAALTIFSTLASGFGVYFVYLAGRELFGRRAGLISAVLLAVSTTFWFQGEIAAPYTGDLALSALIAWLCLRSRRGDHKNILLAAFFLGIAGAYRPQTMFFLGPLLLFTLWGRSLKIWLAAGLIAAITAGALFTPAILESGGLKAYLTEVFQLANTTSAKHQASHGYLRYLGYILTTLLITFKAVGEVISIFAILGIWASRKQKSTNLFLVLWFLPTWLVFSLLYPGNPGTILVCIPPFFIWAGFGFEYLLSQERWQTSGKISLGLVVIWQILVFIFLPHDLLPYRNIENASELDRIKRHVIAGLGMTAELPVDQTIVFADSHRHMQYYLPEYLSCTIPKISKKQPALIASVLCTQYGTTTTTQGTPRDELVPNGTRYIVFLDISPEGVPASAPWIEAISQDEFSIWVIEIPADQRAVWTNDGVILTP